MAPPLGLTCGASSASPSCLSTPSAWAAKASFSSIRSISFMLSPARSSTLRTAGTGPSPISFGSTPAVAMATIRARGVSPWAMACCELAIISAAAPSLTPEAFPAVTTPPLRNGVFSRESCSRVVSARGCSSSYTVLTAPLPPIIGTGTISCARMPSRWARAVRCWLRYAKAS